jgi:hypothetical protein
MSDALNSMIAATPKAAHSFKRVRSFDVGLVIVWFSVVDRELPAWRSLRLGTAAESDFIVFAARKSTCRIRARR